jgi:prevent-host-death family protein
MKEQNISVSEFKKHCLRLFEKIQRRGDEIVVTKRGEPIAKIIPLRKDVQTLRGSMRDQLVIKGDIVECDWSEEWEALQ